MRRVKRRFTAKAKPLHRPAPWTFRPEYPEGAPRVCRSNYHWPVMLQNKQVGVIDRMLHLYSHWGLTSVSTLVRLEDVWHVLYDSESEWSVVSEYGFWIEFVDDTREVVARISREDAQRFGHQMKHGTRTVWAVPFEHYQKHRRN